MAGSRGSVPRLQSQSTGCTFQRLPPQGSRLTQARLRCRGTKGAAEGLRAPGRCLRDPTEKKCRPRWQVPEAQFQGCSPQAARSRGSLPRLPPDAGKAAVQGYQRRCGGLEGAWTLPSGPYRKEVQAEVAGSRRSVPRLQSTGCTFQRLPPKAPA